MSRFSAALVACALVLGMIAGLMYAVSTTQARLEDAQQQLGSQAEDLTQARADLAGRDALLGHYRQQSQRNAALATSQAAELANLTTALQARSLRLKQLERDNDTLRDWAATALPEPVIRLHQHPAITGAAAYRAWLSASGAVPVAGKPPDP